MEWAELEQSMLDAVAKGLYETVTLRTVVSSDRVDPVTRKRDEARTDVPVKANVLPARTVPGLQGGGLEVEQVFVIHAVAADGTPLPSPPRAGSFIVLNAGTPGEVAARIASAPPENGGRSYRVTTRRALGKR